jgi:DNA-binding LacI/PurR family transcriptional regulator
MVTLPTFEMGVQAMRALKRVMADPSAVPNRVVLSGSLTERASCGRHEGDGWHPTPMGER